MTNLKQYLENLKALEARATPEVWRAEQDEYVHFVGEQFYRVVGSETFIAGGRIQSCNADFIAASRNALPKLIEALEETVGALEVCDLALKAAKPCVTGGHDMNENIAADALAKVNALIGEAK